MKPREEEMRPEDENERSAERQPKKGLVREAMTEPEASDEPADTEAEPDTGEAAAGGEALTPEEQDAYKRAVLSGAEVLYSDETGPRIVEMLKAGAGNPAQVLAQVAALLITQLDEKSGMKIPEAVLLPAAMEIMALVAELAEKAGIFQVDEKTFTVAVQQMLVQVGDRYGVSEEEIRALIEGMDPADIQRIVSQQQSYHGQQQQPPAAPAGGV